jgi:hypothetical protein
MKKTKLIIATILLTVSLVSTGFATDGGNDKMLTAKTVISLNNQIYDEILNVLNLPVYLAYADKNLKGDAFVTMTVNKEGKLVIAKIFGENDVLNNYLNSKISSRNLWTPQKYANSYFRYKIHVEANS